MLVGISETTRLLSAIGIILFNLILSLWNIIIIFLNLIYLIITFDYEKTAQMIKQSLNGLIRTENRIKQLKLVCLRYGIDYKNTIKLNYSNGLIPYN